MKSRSQFKVVSLRSATRLLKAERSVSLNRRESCFIHHRQGDREKGYNQVCSDSLREESPLIPCHHNVIITRRQFGQFCGPGLKFTVAKI